MTSCQLRALSAAIVLTAAAFPPPARAEVLEKSRTVAGVTVHYKVVLPTGYDPAKAYPAILAFGGGPQTMNTVDGVLTRNFRAEAEKRGYIVIAPAAPDGELFFERRCAHLPRVPEADSRGLQDPGRQVPRRRAVQRRHRGVPRRGGQPAILPLGHRVPRIHVGAQRGQAPGDLEDVRVHVRRRNRRVHVARRDEAAKRSSCAPRARSRATPSRRASRTGSRRLPAPAPDACSTASRRRGKGAVSERADSTVTRAAGGTRPSPRRCAPGAYHPPPRGGSRSCRRSPERAPAR